MTYLRTPVQLISDNNWKTTTTEIIPHSGSRLDQQLAVDGVERLSYEYRTTIGIGIKC